MTAPSQRIYYEAAMAMAIAGPCRWVPVFNDVADRSIKAVECIVTTIIIIPMTDSMAQEAPSTAWAGYSCQNPACGKPAQQACPKCKELGLEVEFSTFCSQSCFTVRIYTVVYARNPSTDSAGASQVGGSSLFLTLYIGKPAGRMEGAQGCSPGWVACLALRDEPRRGSEHRAPQV